ncbi:MAG: xanthine dehydrogenase small subunit, partial [Gammaproteobacteria bacterium]|nr:xanthine dehydrogenase small subunit [Gammaproteobacteria bacterium]
SHGFAKGKATRELALHEFYLGYQQKTMEPGEFVESTRIPLPMENTQFRTYKISKRFDQDISAVCGAFSLALDNNTVHDIRICYGGMAATPKRALQCENTIKDRKWNEATVDAAVAALALDYKPLNDMRASAEYRILVAANLLRKFFIDTTEVEPGTYVREYGT